MGALESVILQAAIVGMAGFHAAAGAAVVGLCRRLGNRKYEGRLVPITESNVGSEICRPDSVNRDCADPEHQKLQKPMKSEAPTR